MPVAKHFLSVLSFILLSLAAGYSAYIYLLQASSLSSLGRQVITLTICGLSFAYLSWRRRRLRKLISRQNLPALAALIIILNLALAAALTSTPYTQQLLPSRSVRIQPLPGDRPVMIQSFSTELEQWVGIDSFESRTGWHEENGKISANTGSGDSLVWQGKPGAFVLIELVSCPDCGMVEVSFDGQDAQKIDLSQANPERTLSIRYDYPSLLWQKLFNFLALQTAVLVITVLLLDLGTALFAAARKPGKKLAQPLSRTPAWMPPLIITAYSVIVYGLQLRPVLFNDDWCQIVYWLNFDTIELFMLEERRPLNMFLPWLFDRFLPVELSIMALYVALLAILTLTAILIYYLILQLTPGRRWFALLVALLWLVFPNDYTRLYITMIGIRTGYLAMIAVMILITRFIREGGLSTALLASMILLASFFLYEGHVGLAIAWPLLCLYLFRTQFTRQRLPGLLIYASVVGIFLAWRLIIQPAYYEDAKLVTINQDPWVILERYFHALPTILGGFRSPYPGFDWSRAGTIAILSLAALCLALAFAWARKTWNVDFEGQQGGLPLAALLLTGVVLWLAGYFPILLNFPPNIYGHLSRVNIFSIPGAVLILLILLFTVTLALSRDPRKAAAAVSLLAISMLLVGTAIQIQVQDSNLAAWEESKTFYRALVGTVPDVAPGTQIVILLNGVPVTGDLHRPVFSASWEAACAVRTLYDQPDLEVMYRYEHIYVPPFPSNGVLAGAMETDTIGTLNDPARLLVLEYDRSTGRLSVRQGAAGILQPGSSTGYAPQQRILPPGKVIPSRKLIEGTTVPES